MSIQQIAGMQTGLNIGQDLNNKPNNDQLREEIRSVLAEEQQKQNPRTMQYNIDPTIYKPSITQGRGELIQTPDHLAAKQEYLNRSNIRRNDMQASSGFIPSQFSRDVHQILKNNTNYDMIRTPEEKMRQEQEAQAAMEQINQVRASNHSALISILR